MLFAEEVQCQRDDLEGERGVKCNPARSSGYSCAAVWWVPGLMCGLEPEKILRYSGSKILQVLAGLQSACPFPICSLAVFCYLCPSLCFSPWLRVGPRVVQCQMFMLCLSACVLVLSQEYVPDVGHLLLFGLRNSTIFS